MPSPRQSRESAAVGPSSPRLLQVQVGLSPFLPFPVCWLPWGFLGLILATMGRVLEAKLSRFQVFSSLPCPFSALFLLCASPDPSLEATKPTQSSPGLGNLNMAMEKKRDPKGNSPKSLDHWDGPAPPGKGQELAFPAAC